MYDPIKSDRWKKLRQRLYLKARANGDRCWICGGEIDYDAPAHHPDSWEPDHVKPRSKHPELVFDVTNIRSSHASCNASKSDKQVPLGLGRRRSRLNG